MYDSRSCYHFPKIEGGITQPNSSPPPNSSSFLDKRGEEEKEEEEEEEEEEEFLFSHKLRGIAPHPTPTLSTRNDGAILLFFSPQTTHNVAQQYPTGLLNLLA